MLVIEPLTKEFQEIMRKEVDASYDKFVSDVARQRDMDEQAVRDTQADSYTADKAKEIGLVDSVGKSRDSFNSFVNHVNFKPATDGVSAIERKQEMSGANKEGENQNTVDAKTLAEQARKDERKRFATVQSSEFFGGREELANHLLSETDMTGEQIVATLKVSPKKEAQKAESKEDDAPRNHFAEAMDSENTPKVQAEDDAGEEESSDPTMTANTKSILAAHVMAGGKVVNPEILN